METTILLIVGIYLLGVVVALLLWVLYNRMFGVNGKPDAIPLLSWALIVFELLIIIIGSCASLFNKINDKLCTDQDK